MSNIRPTGRNRSSSKPPRRTEASKKKAEVTGHTPTGRTVRKEDNSNVSAPQGKTTEGLELQERNVTQEPEVSIDLSDITNLDKAKGKGYIELTGNIQDVDKAYEALKKLLEGNDSIQIKLNTKSNAGGEKNWKALLKKDENGTIRNKIISLELATSEILSFKRGEKVIKLPSAQTLHIQHTGYGKQNTFILLPESENLKKVTIQNIYPGTYMYVSPEVPNTNINIKKIHYSIWDDNNRPCINRMYLKTGNNNTFGFKHDVYKCSLIYPNRSGDVKLNSSKKSDINIKKTAESGNSLYQQLYSLYFEMSPKKIDGFVFSDLRHSHWNEIKYAVTTFGKKIPEAIRAGRAIIRRVDGEFQLEENTSFKEDLIQAQRLWDFVEETHLKKSITTFITDTKNPYLGSRILACPNLNKIELRDVKTTDGSKIQVKSTTTLFDSATGVLDLSTMDSTHALKLLVGLNKNPEHSISKNLKEVKLPIIDLSSREVKNLFHAGIKGADKKIEIKGIKGKLELLPHSMGSSTLTIDTIHQGGTVRIHEGHKIKAITVKQINKGARFVYSPNDDTTNKVFPPSKPEGLILKRGKPKIKGSIKRLFALIVLYFKKAEVQGRILNLDDLKQNISIMQWLKNAPTAPEEPGNNA